MSATTTPKHYRILNADGLEVSAYDNLDHATWAAEEMAGEGYASARDFYSVTDVAGHADYGSWRSTTEGEGGFEPMP